MKTKFRFVFHEEKCIQCHGCELACRTSKPTQDHIYRRKITNVWHGEYPKVTSSSMTTACKHCENPLCVSACPVDAISKDINTGAVIVDQQLCIGCQACLSACPWDIPQFTQEGKMDKCDMCYSLSCEGNVVPACVKTCPTGALELVPVETTP